MNVIPYATQSINEDDLAAVRVVLSLGGLTLGPAVPRVEQAFAWLRSVAHAVGHTTSMRQALHHCRTI